MRRYRAVPDEAGSRRLFEEKVSGARRDRPELAKMIEQQREGDTVVVTWRDRLVSSTRGLLDTVETPIGASADLHSLAEPRADTTSPVLTVFAGLPSSSAY